MILISLLSVAFAGDGPWTLNPGETNVYVGMDAFRYGRFNNGIENLSLGTSLSSIGATAVLTRGMVRGVEVEVRIPYARVRANSPEVDACGVDAPRERWCEATQGIGNIVAIGKFRLLDESNLRPLSLSLGGVFRTGEFYSEERGRITTLGDGQTDVGLIASAGRSGELAKGWYRVSLSAGYMYRFAHSNDGQKIPADEVFSDATLVISPTGWFSIGPTASAFSKTGGVDVVDADLTNLDGFASLAGAQVKVGGTFAVYGEKGITLSVTAQRTVYAHNNPIDTTSVSIGLGWFMKPRSDPPITSLR